MEPIKAEIVVLGAGPGGYTAAFYAADKGKQVILVDQEKRLGGVCLNEGCIPSKALLHATEPIRGMAGSEARGITFGPPVVDLGTIRRWKGSVLDKLGAGVRSLAQKRGVEILTGRGRFEDSSTLRVETAQGQRLIRFEQAIIAAGSKPAMPPAFDLGDKRVMTSTEALELEEIPRNLLVIGGGYIGLELGTVYSSLGSTVTLVEAAGSILLGVDPDLAHPVLQRAQRMFKAVRLSARVCAMAAEGKKIKVTVESQEGPKEELYDRVLVAVGRVPNCDKIGLECTQVARDDRGFIKADVQRRTDDPRIYAIGDATGGILLAHKASKEARIAVEAIVGERSAFERVVIPAVVFTDPEVAWCGLTETEARQREIPVEIARFPWSASGRAVSVDRPDGMTKLVLEPETERILGVGIAGIHAGDLIGEGVLAVEMGATARDLAETVHPHPTFSETLMECAESFYGFSTHMAARKK